MSIKVMSAIFETEFAKDFDFEKDGEKRSTKASTAKLVLLAIADHCNDDGIAYPGLTRLELKTALSRQGIVDTIEALKYNGILTIKERNSTHNTNTYALNLEAFPMLGVELPKQILGTVVKPLDQGSKATLPGVVKPLDLNHQLTINKPLTDEPKTKQQKNIDTFTSLLEEDNGSKNPSARRDKTIADLSNKGKLEPKDFINATKKTMAIIEASDNSKKKGYTKLPEQYHPYAKAFTDATGIVFIDKYTTDWIGTFNDFIDVGFQPEDITQAIEAIVKEGKAYTISRPGSIEWKLNGIRTDRKTHIDKAYNPWN